jgi:signal transduction histidine kinase
MYRFSAENTFFRCIFTFFFLLISPIGYSQKYSFKDIFPVNNGDSLEQWLMNNPKVNEDRLKNLIKIERKYAWEINPKKFKYLNEIEKTAKTLKNLGGIAYWKINKSELLNNESQNNEAVKSLTEALQIATKLKDVSAQINILCNLSLIYINHGNPQTDRLAKEYILRAKTLLNQSNNDPHARMLFLIVYLNYETSKVYLNEKLGVSLLEQILTLYNSNPALEYSFIRVKLIETNFYFRTKNYVKASIINNELLRKTAPNNFYLLSRINFNFARIYNASVQYDKALKANQLAIDYFRKIPQNVFCQQTDETTNNGLVSGLIEMYLNYRSITMKLNDVKTSNSLADSIIFYQKTGLDKHNFNINEIQSRYNFEWNELELKDRATEKRLTQLLQNNLQNKLQIEQKKMEALLFKNEFEQSEKKIKQIKQDSEKQIALAKSKIIENKNGLLYIYILMISILLILMIILLIVLRIYSNREKKIALFKDKFYTILTHDLRGSINSLTDLGAVLSHLIRNGKTEEIEKIANQIDYLGCSTSLLLDNMLDWGTAKSYGLDTSPKSFDISVFIHELVSRYLAALKTKNIDIFLNIPDYLIVTTSPKCLDAIIRNAISNAKSHTDEGGRIDIIVKENKMTNQIFIDIKDTGEGISNDKLEFIQQVFMGKIKPEVGEYGLGLGIILMSYFAQKNNSILEVTSKVTVGSCFTLKINITPVPKRKFRIKNILNCMAKRLKFLKI